MGVSSDTGSEAVSLMSVSVSSVAHVTAVE